MISFGSGTNNLLRPTLKTEIQALVDDGYVILPDVLMTSECEAYKEILEHAYDKFSPDYVGNATAKHRLNNVEDEKIVFNIHNKDQSFLKLIDYPEVFDIVEGYLKLGSYQRSDPIILRQNTARTPLKGKPIQQLHIDSRLPGCHYPLMAVAIWLLDDFTQEKGATRVVPGSHKEINYPEDGKSYPNELILEANKGTVIIIDGGIWHGSGENKTSQSRWCILSTYVRWFFKSAFDFNQNMPVEFYQMLTERQMQVMGYTSNPPKDEFTRLSARSTIPDVPVDYCLPK